MDPATLALLGQGLDAASSLFGSGVLGVAPPPDYSTSLNTSGVAPISFTIGGLGSSPARSNTSGEVNPNLEPSAVGAGAVSSGVGGVDLVLLVGVFAVSYLAVKFLKR